jgi:hypothetical protein
MQVFAIIVFFESGNKTAGFRIDRRFTILRFTI